MKKNKTTILVVILLLLLVLPVFINQVEATSVRNLIGLDTAQNIELPDAGDTEPLDLAVQIIRFLLTFLGVIAVAIILYGGFIWMTASGSEERVNRAKRIITAGVIGLIIVLASYAIVSFVTDITTNAINGEI